jgi:hypothetical protein
MVGRRTLNRVLRDAVRPRSVLIASKILVQISDRREAERHFWTIPNTIGA